MQDKVRETIERNKLCFPGDQVVVGVSGGPDSLALLHVLRALQHDLAISLHVAHLNHQLRGADADADAEFVAGLAREWNVPATIETRDVAAAAREGRQSVEQAARQARYAFFAEVATRLGARRVAVGHNADDQVETVLMHFLRGAGLAGLRGMSYDSGLPPAAVQVGEGQRDKPEGEDRSAEVRLVRPLLDVTRVQIDAYCQAHALTPRLDRTNLDTTLFRNRLRHEVLPYLEALNPNLRTVLRRMSRALADDYDLIQSQVDQAHARVARVEEDAVVFALGPWRALHPALQRGTLRAAVRELRRDLRNIDWTHIEDARRVALEKGAGTQATLPDGLALVVGYGEFSIADAARPQPPLDLPLLNVERLVLPVPGAVMLPESTWRVETAVESELADRTNRWTAWLDRDRVVGELALRRRRPGDRLQPAGLHGHYKSLNEFMIDARIPRRVRDRLPLLVAGDQLLWVCGWRVDERVRVTPATRQVLRVTFRKKDSS